MNKVKYIRLEELNNITYNNIVPNEIVNQFLTNSGTQEEYKYSIFIWYKKGIYKDLQNIAEDCWYHHITIPIENMVVEDITVVMLKDIQEGILENGKWYVIKRGKKVEVDVYRKKLWHVPNWYYEKDGKRFYILDYEFPCKHLSRVYHPSLPNGSILTPFDPNHIFNAIGTKDKLVIDWEDIEY